MILGRAVLGTVKAILGALYGAPSAGSGPVVADAYLEDFLVVPAGDRFLAVDVIDRWMVVPSDRFIEVVR